MLSPKKAPILTLILNSSSISLFKHSSAVSPFSIFPPGNSHLLANLSAFFLFAIKKRPSFVKIAAVTFLILSHSINILMLLSFSHFGQKRNKNKILPHITVSYTHLTLPTNREV